MKKVLLLLIILFSTIKVYALELTPNAKSSILIEPETKTIIYEKNANEKVAMASLTKMMGLIIIFEKLDNGEIKYTDKVIASSNASGMGGSQIWLETGEEMSVDELLKGVIMASGNDAIVALAEYVAGDEETFVKMMNEKAKTLGLKNTNFVNVTGLDEEGHFSTAYDLSLIATELMTHSDVFKYTTVYEDYLRKNTDNKFWLVNTNKLIKTYKGADGLKTGMTDNAGYCMAVTAKRDNMRLLSIVLGEKEGKVRNKETEELLDYGFNQYEMIKIKEKGEILKEINIDKANPNKVTVTLDKDILVLQKRNNPKKEYTSEIKIDNLKLPLKKGDVIGKLLVKDGTNTIKQVNLVSNEDIKKENFFKLWLNVIKNVFTGNLIN